MKVLVVGDDSRKLLALARVVRRLGWACVTGGDAAHALIHARGQQPGAVVLDAALAEGGCLAALRGLRASAALAALPVLVAGPCAAESWQAFQEAGARELLADPLDEAAVGEALRRVVAERDTPGAPPGQEPRQAGAGPGAVPQQAPAAVLADPGRLAALAASGLLDSPPEPAFERITQLVAELLSAPTALFSLVDKDRQFFKSQVGLPAPWARRRQTPLTHSFCQWVVSGNEPMAVNDARRHALLRHNEAIRDMGVIAYTGIPVRAPGGAALGSLCAIDARPRDWSAGDRDTLQDLARIAECEILRSTLARCTATDAAAREQGIAAAVAALAAVTGILRRQGSALREQERELLCQMIAEYGEQLARLGRQAHYGLPPGAGA